MRCSPHLEMETGTNDVTELSGTDRENIRKQTFSTSHMWQTNTVKWTAFPTHITFTRSPRLTGWRFGSISGSESASLYQSCRFCHRRQHPARQIWRVWLSSDAFGSPPRPPGWSAGSMGHWNLEHKAPQVSLKQDGDSGADVKNGENHEAKLGMQLKLFNYKVLNLWPRSVAWSLTFPA